MVRHEFTHSHTRTAPPPGCDHPSRHAAQPGKNKEQLCNSAAYKTINIVQGCSDTVITHRSESRALCVCMCITRTGRCVYDTAQRFPLYCTLSKRALQQTLPKTKYSAHVAVPSSSSLTFLIQFSFFPPLPSICSPLCQHLCASRTPNCNQAYGAKLAFPSLPPSDAV